MILGAVASSHWVQPSLPATVLTSDSFNRADTASGVLGTTDAAAGGAGMVWSQDVNIASPSPTLQIASNQARRAVTATGSPHFGFVPAATADMWVRAKISVLPSSSSCGVVARASGSAAAQTHYYITVGSTGSIQILKRIAGVATALSSTIATIVAGDTVGLACLGTWIAATVNGVVVGFVFNNEISSGNAGIHSSVSTARLDDFIVLVP